MDATREEINEVGRSVVDGCVRVHRALGAGLLESVYQTCIVEELLRRGHRVASEVAMPINYEGIVIETGFRVDLIVNELVIVENKAVQAVLPVHHSQLLTYLRLSGYRLGFLINWNVPLIKEGITRVVNKL